MNQPSAAHWAPLKGTRLLLRRVDQQPNQKFPSRLLRWDDVTDDDTEPTPSDGKQLCRYCPVWTFHISCNDFEPLHCPGEPDGKQENISSSELPATLAYQESQWATDQMHFVTFPGQGGTAEKME